MDYLIHGGRVGKLAGISANILNLRPMILMTQGELFPSGLARGRVQSRKKAMEKLFTYIEENGNDPGGVHTGPHPIGFGLCEKSC